MQNGRREIKYLLGHAEYLVLKARVSALLGPDPHCGPDGYFIRSIYFDDHLDTAYREKINGVFDRRKYRLRTYDGDEGTVKLECKEKYDRFIVKRAAALDADCGRRLIAGDCSALAGAGGVAREFYVAAAQSGLRAVVAVDYVREAYVYPASNLRVTFDRHLRAGGPGGFRLARGGGLTLPVYDRDDVIMEIKYDDCLPSFIGAALSHEAGKPQSVSKYCLCRDVMGRVS